MATSTKIESILVEASVQKCFDVCVDVESYPQWASGIVAAEVLEKGTESFPAKVRFEAESFGRRSSYVLAYSADVPNQFAWSLVEGDVAREIAGSYSFAQADGSSQITNVSYELTIDLAVKLPAFIKRRAEDKILQSALADFKQRVEGL